MVSYSLAESTTSVIEMRDIANYADIAGAFANNPQDATFHFIQSGYAEGRLWEDPLDYVASFSDLIGAFSGLSGDQVTQAAIEHFMASGRDEGRRDGIDFDVDTYLANYDDLRLAFATPDGQYDEHAATLHYIQSGYAEGRTDDFLLA